MTILPHNIIKCKAGQRTIDRAGDPSLPAGHPNLPAGDPNLPAGDPNLPAGDPNLPAGDPNLPAGDPNLPAGDPSVPASPNPGSAMMCALVPSPMCAVRELKASGS